MLCTALNSLENLLIIKTSIILQCGLLQDRRLTSRNFIHGLFAILGICPLEIGLLAPPERVLSKAPLEGRFVGTNSLARQNSPSTCRYLTT